MIKNFKAVLLPLALVTMATGCVGAPSDEKEDLDAVDSRDDELITGTEYFVSGTGVDTNSGTADKPFRTIQKAAGLTVPGDVVTVMNGTYTNASPNGSVVNITRSGNASAWIKYRAYPGHSPKLKFTGWNGFSLSGGASYIEITGFSMEGSITDTTLAYCTGQKDVANPLCNSSGVTIDGRKDGATKPHHVRVANNHIFNCAGAGIAAIQADYITVEDNQIHDNSWYTRYATSAISLFQAWRFDEGTGYKMFVRRNRTWNNKTLVPWEAIDKLSDGNGIIIDDSKNTQNGSTLGAYKGRFLVADNVSFNNGGSGIHAYVSEHVDIFNNTAYHNGTVVGYPDIYAASSNDVNIINNIMFARPDGRPNSNYGNTSTRYDYNIYFGGTGPEVIGPNDRVIDPLFVNPSTDPALADFHLRQGSPAVDTGESNSNVSGDHVGAARPQGNAFDRGAYESPYSNTVGGTPVRDGEVVVNGGFEAGAIAGWSSYGNLTVGSTGKSSGLFAAQAGTATAAGGGEQKVNVEGNTYYTLRASGQVANGQWGAIGYVLLDSAGTKIGSDTYLSSFGATQAERSVSFTTTADTAAVKLLLWTTAGAMYVDNVSLVSNLIGNGGLESGVLGPWSNWAATKVVSTNQNSGGFALQAGTSTTSGGGAQSVFVRPNATYTLRMSGRVANGQFGSGNYQLRTSAGVTIGSQVSLPVFGATYAERTVTFTTPATAGRIDVSFWTNAGAMYLDDISLIQQ
ncbi:MAG: choice-of-anchor Q domain-containing protein [Byssovorax sp.]